MATAPHPLRIGIADDDGMICETLRGLLGQIGHEVIFACKSGEDLIKRCRRHKPDLVITDQLMPGMTGLDAALVVYNDLQIPIILMSSCCNSQVIAQGAKHRVSEYLSKPIGKEQLEAAILVAIAGFNNLQALNSQMEALKSRMQDLEASALHHSLVHHAVCLLMKRDGTSLQEARKAFKRLAEKSTPGEAARSIVDQAADQSLCGN